MKYFIKARWFRQCPAMPYQTDNFVIAEEPNAWLERQQARLGDYWTGIAIDSCCQVSDEAVVSPDPDLGHRSTPEENAAVDRGFLGLGIAVLSLAVGIILLLVASALCSS